MLYTTLVLLVNLKPIKMKFLFYSLFTLLLITSCSPNEDEDFLPENSSKSLRVMQFNGCQRNIMTWGDTMADRLEELINNCSPVSAATHGEVLTINTFYYEFGPYTSTGSSEFGMKSGVQTYSVTEQDQIIADARAASLGWIQNKVQTDPAYYHLRNKTPHISYDFETDVYVFGSGANFFSLEVTYVFEQRIRMVRTHM
jgi:hypothetical protein